MIALLARLNVAAGKEKEFESVMLELAAAVRANEPGNQLYTLVKGRRGLRRDGTLRRRRGIGRSWSE